jgi:hypothetical protein
VLVRGASRTDVMLGCGGFDTGVVIRCVLSKQAGSVAQHSSVIMETLHATSPCKAVHCTHVRSCPGHSVEQGVNLLSAAAVCRCCVTCVCDTYV